MNEDQVDCFLLLDGKVCGPFIIGIQGLYKTQSPKGQSISDIELPAVGAIVVS